MFGADKDIYFSSYFIFYFIHESIVWYLRLLITQLFWNLAMQISQNVDEPNQMIEYDHVENGKSSTNVEA